MQAQGAQWLVGKKSLGRQLGDASNDAPDPNKTDQHVKCLIYAITMSLHLHTGTGIGFQKNAAGAPGAQKVTTCTINDRPMVDPGLL